jgi:hypothetical protein
MPGVTGTSSKTARLEGRWFRTATQSIAAGVVSVVAAMASPAPGVLADARAAQPGDSAVGSGKNQFLIALGEAHLSVSAHSDAAGADPTGHVRATGDPDGSGPLEPFRLEGEVTCLRVHDNRAAIKYRFKHAEGSAAPLEGGGVQIFLEDNGNPSGGEAVDRATFDPPQPAGAFEAAANQCNDPDSRTTYDKIESGNFVVRDALP